MQRHYALVFTVLAVGFLSTSVAAAANGVYIGNGTVTDIRGGTVNLDLTDKNKNSLRIDDNTVLVDQFEFTMRPTNPVFVTLRSIDRFAPDNEVAVEFAGTATGTNNVEFILRNLLPDAQYRIEKDGNTLTTSGTDATGQLSFTVSDWSKHIFRILKIPSNPFTTPREEVRLELGEELSSYLTLYNSEGQPTTYDIRVDTSMGQGKVVANLLTRGRATTQSQVEVGPEEYRSIPVRYTAASCLTNLCTGSVTYTIHNLETDRVRLITVSTIIERDKSVYGSPGITLAHIAVIALAGAFLFLTTSKRK